MYARWLAISLSLFAAIVLLMGCNDVPEAVDPDDLPIPPADTSDRAQRDSARVANLLISYFSHTQRGREGDALQLYFPDSILVATESGGIQVEGQSSVARMEIRRDFELAPVARIELLRREESAMLEETFREIWYVRWIEADAESARVQRRIHVIQQIGSDVRLLGRMDPDWSPTP